MATLDDAMTLLDETEETLADTQATPSFAPPVLAKPKVAPTLDDAVELLADDPADGLRTTASVARDTDSAHALKTLRLYGKTGLPYEFIKENADLVEQESARQDFNPDKLVKDSPAFAAWLAQHPDHVAAAMPDLDKIGYFEKQWRYMSSSHEAGKLKDELVDIGGKAFAETITIQDRKRQAELEQRLEAIGRSKEGLDLDVVSQVPGEAIEQFPNLMRGLKGKVEFGAKGLVAGTAAGAVVGSAAGPHGTAAGAIGGGTVGGLTGWRYGAAINAGIVERNTALIDYEKLKDDQGNLLDRTTIKGLSLMAGAINGSVEGLTGMEAMIDRLPGIKQLTRKGIKELLKTPTARAAILGMAKDVGNVMVTEGATEAFQMYVTKAGGEIAKWAADGGGPVDVLSRIFSRENFEQAKMEALRGAQAGGGTATVLSTPGLVQDLQQVRQAKQNQRAFEAMGQAAASSQFAKDLPDHLKQIIAEATKNGPVEQVYIPTDAFNTYFQGKGVDPREVAAAITGSLDAYDQAIQTGQDLPISMADYASKLAGTEHNEFFARELRTALDQMNAREAEEWQREMDAQVSTPQAGVSAMTADTPAAKVQHDIMGQLQAAWLDQIVAEKYAKLYADRYAARAERRGLAEDPAELFRKLNLSVTKQIPDVLKTLGGKTTELDALLNRLRVGDVPTPETIYGQSLGEFLKSKGGVQDQGELAGRNLDKNRTAFSKKLVHEKGLTLDDAALRAQEAGYLQERSIQALLDALDRESSGKPVYAIQQENVRALEIQTNLDSLQHFLADRQIDVNTTNNEQIKALLGEAIQQPLPAAEGQTFAQGRQTETAAFKKWFGDSKVVDADGKPLVVYHGTKPGTRTIDPNKILDNDKQKSYDIEIEKIWNVYREKTKEIFKVKNYHLNRQLNDAVTEALDERNAGVSAVDQRYGQGLLTSIAYDNVELHGESFDPQRSADIGIHFSESPGVASKFAGPFGSVFPVYLKIDRLERINDVFSRHKGLSAAVDEFNRIGVLTEIESSALDKLGERGDAQEFQDERDWGSSKQVVKFWDKARDIFSKKRGDLGFVYFNEVEGGGDSYAVFSPSQIKSATGNAGIFDPKNPSILLQTFNEGDKPKGSITFGDGQISIQLLEKADLSTFIHETGHLWLNELVDDALTVGTPDQLRVDLDTILAWMKLSVRSAQGTEAVKAAIQTVHHEQFARGFEAYAMEGTAPSHALREIFATFRQWLIQVYRSLTTGPLHVNLTKDVRGVFDRMIATDEAIDAAAQEAEIYPMFTDAESAGMTPTQFSAYQETVKRASLTARESLQTKLMAQYKREQQDWWKARREEILAAVTIEVNDQPAYVALAVLKTGKMPDGSEIPHGIEAMKLDKKAVADQFGKDFLKRIPRGLTSKDGMHQDAVGQLFGYATGEEFVLALVNARPKQQLIEATTDQRMKEQYGDIRFDGTIAEEAQAAVLNEHQEEVIAAEMRALNAKRREVAPFVKAAATEAKAQQTQGRDLLSTMIPTLEETRTLARNILSRTALKNIEPFKYSVTARQASKKATAALLKQDYVQAGHYKQQELLNLALFREAGIIQGQQEQALELVKKIFKPDAGMAKTRNVDLINVARAILAQYGLGRPSDKTAAEYLKPIEAYDLDLYNQWKPQVDALAPRPLDYKALTVQEFTELHEDMQALWLLSRRTRQTLIHGQMEDRADIIDLLTAEIASKTTREQSRILGQQTTWEDTKVGLLSMASALRRVESWVDAMDGGNINGIFRRYLWTPISEAADAFRADKKHLITQYLELVKPIEGTITRDLIPANELGDGFAFRGKGALLHAILHTGNESNKAKLLKGYGWDTGTWDAFLTRAWQDSTLTRADYDYAQGVWDLLESIKPHAQRAHHEMYGYYFSEVTASPVQTPWGEYRGGYVPAIADSAKSVDQAIRQEKDLFDQAGNSFMFPTTGRGFTKARVETYAAPLALNLASIPVHLDKVMRFVHLEPRVKDIARIVTNKAFRASLDAMNPTTAKDMLVPWLQRSAQQTVSTPGKNRHMDRLFRYLRNTTGAQIMVGNVVNTLQQFTGFSISLIKVRGRYLRGALVSYLSGPGAMADAIAEKSTFMAGRTMTQVIDVQQQIDDILLNPTKYEKAKDFARQHGYFLQQATQNVVDVVTWSGAYDQAIHDGADEDEAVRTADSAVRETQGSFNPEDISAFEAGTPFVRAFTMFYSYFNMQANLLGTEFQTIMQDAGLRKGAGRAFGVYFFGFMIPAVMAEVIVAGLGGFDPDDDDGYLNELLSVAFGSQLRTALALVPGVGPIALAGINAFNKKWYDDRISTSPIVSTIEGAVRAPHSLYQAMTEDGHSKKAIRDVLTLIGLVTGTPAAALSRPLGYLGAVYDGVATPENAVDVGRGLISGKDVNRKK